jgi:hypothetical protein
MGIRNQTPLVSGSWHGWCYLALLGGWTLRRDIGSSSTHEIIQICRADIGSIIVTPDLRESAALAVSERVGTYAASGAPSEELTAKRLVILEQT